MPCSPPLPPLRKGGKQIARSHRHSIPRNKNGRLETVPRAHLTPSFRHPTLPPLRKGGNLSRGCMCRDQWCEAIAASEPHSFERRPSHFPR